MATLIRWTPPVELSTTERRVAKVLTRIGKFYVFLREVRHELFDEEFQAELAAAYAVPRGTAPLPPALLAMVTLLQAYDQIGDADAVVTAQMDRRWQLVLDCLDAEESPFSQGVLSQFRARMIEHELDQKLLDRTVELAKRTGTFGWQHLKAALDSSPLLGAGRVLDTWNLIGRALSTVVTCAAKATGRPRDAIVAEAELTLAIAPSLKTALDINWDDADERGDALARLLEEVDRIETWVAEHAASAVAEPPLREALTALRRVLAQDLEPDPTTGRARIKRGVAKDRMPSLGDPEMRHGRKSKTKLFNGYKRHVMKIVGADVTVAATVLPANQPEHDALPLLVDELTKHGSVEELLMDRGYLASPRIAELRDAGVVIRCKPWNVRNGDRFPKSRFEIRLDEQRVICPAGVSTPIASSLVARFPVQTCAACPLRKQCTSAKNHGRSVTVHPQEELLVGLRRDLKAADGRAALRQRTTVEHSLARLGAIQGQRARYKGTRKNTLDVRRCAAVDNLQTVARLRVAA
ncbi:MAG: IS1182 family transposase [Gemmatimonadaceae bacterium]